MRRSVSLLIGAGLLLAATPLAGQAHTGPACTVPPGAHLVTAGAGGYSGFVPTPAVPSQAHALAEQPIPEESITRATFVLDMGPDVVAATNGDADIVLSWGDQSDFDLFVYQGSELLGSDVKFNVLDGSGEAVNLFGQGHCATIRVEVHNLSGNPLADLALNTTITKVRHK